jgi:hypothetical protein
MIPTIRYEYSDATPRCSSEYLWPALEREIHNRSWPSPKRAFDLGCGNGTIADLKTVYARILALEATHYMRDRLLRDADWPVRRIRWRSASLSPITSS